MAIASINRAIKEEITQLEKRLKVLRRIIDFNSDTKPAKAKAKAGKKKTAKPAKRKLSAEARKRIGDAARKRWAKVKKEKAAAK